MKKVKQNKTRLWFYYMDENKVIHRTSKEEMWLQFGPIRKSWNYETKVGKGVRVSTVFIGLDFNTSKSPMLFETMIIGGKRHEETHRYATLMEAEKGHKKIVDSFL